jgi:hypothetical protein
MPTTLSKPFHPTMFRHFIWLSQLSKPSTEHGPVALIGQSMPHLPTHFMLPVVRLTSTMRRLQSLRRILCRWVRILAATQNTTDVFVVLNPKEKLGYFKKHWSPELQEDVATCTEEVVSTGVCFSFTLWADCCSSKNDGYYLVMVLRWDHPRSQEMARAYMRYSGNLVTTKTTQWSI